MLLIKKQALQVKIIKSQRVYARFHLIWISIFIDEDIDIFINKFLDISFQLKSINPDYFVDPLFLFEIKNKIFQTENLAGLRKNLDEDEYNNVLEKLERLRKEEIELENQILESSDLNTYELNTRLSALENDISATRKQLFNLKANLKSFYGTSRTEYKELRERLMKLYYL